MKAVIMAGGKGTRLRPLTCKLPKPMVPLLDRPCMEYGIELLKRHGITEIAVTVQYLPQMIKNYFGDGSEFGVRLHYFEETTPLGTAGSVKNAAEFLDETFLVISGDALTDFHLGEAIEYHKAKQAIGTIVLTRMNVPLEFGVVMTREDGRITRFLEKPSWNEVFSDTVNTGIYVLEPEILQFFAKNHEFDFSKDLFPLVMQQDLPLYGFEANGYWSDIGNLSQYRQTQYDMLNGCINVEIRGRKTLSGVWLADNVKLHPGAQVEGPAFIGEGTVVESGARIGPYAVIGRNSWVEQGTEIEQSVVWNRAYLGKSASISGAVVCNGVRIGDGAIVQEEAVIGDNSWIGDLTVIQSGVKIWPEKTISTGTMQTSSIIWGRSASRSLFGEEGISGTPNYELTPELAGKVAAAYGSCLPRGAAVSISCDEHPYSGILKYSMISSLLAIGIQVRDIGTTLAPIARYECRRSNSSGAIHIRKTGIWSEKQIILQFYDSEGLPIEKGMERKIENAFFQEDFVRPDTKGLGFLEKISHTEEPYLWEILSRVNVEGICNRRFKVVFHCESPQVMAVMHQILDRLGCRVISVFNGGAVLKDIVRDNRADIGVQLDMSARTLRVWTDQGYQLSEEEVLFLQTMISLNHRLPIAIPVTAPSIVEELAEQAGVSYVRTKTVSRSLLEPGMLNPLQVHYDGFYSLALLLDYLAREELTAHQAVADIPDFHMASDYVECPVEMKGRVMRRLMEDVKAQQLELIDGIKVFNEDGWALILPDSERALFKVVVQGHSPDQVQALTNMYKSKIASFKQG